MRPAGPQINIADRISRRLRTCVANRDVHILSPDFMLDQSERFKRKFFRYLESGSSRSPQPELELTSIMGRKNLVSQLKVDTTGNGSSYGTYSAKKPEETSK